MEAKSRAGLDTSDSESVVSDDNVEVPNLGTGHAANDGRPSMSAQNNRSVSYRTLAQSTDPPSGEGQSVPAHSNDHAEVESSEGELDTDDEESLIGEIIESHDVGQLSADTTICSDEDAARFRTRLREIGIEGFVREYISSNAETAKRLVCAFGVPPLPFLEDGPDEGYYKILGALLMRELSRRLKLPHYNTFDDAVALIKKSERILVITGAGISTNLGIPDFRSKNTGFYAQMREEGFEDPTDIFELETFDDDPSIFYRYAYRTLPDGKDTTPTHAFIKLLQDRNQLLTNYTQNIDNIEGNAGLRDDKVIQCHGSWASFTCRKCGFKAPGGSYYYDKVRKKIAPDCPACVDALSNSKAGPMQKRRKMSGQKGAAKWGSGFDSDDEDEDDDIPQAGKMKPDITFFGEKLPDKFFDRFKNHDTDKVDLIVVIGTSMKVAPVSEIPLAVDKNVPQIFISRELTAKHVEFDIVLLGDCDTITNEIATKAGWKLEHPMLAADRKIEVISENESRGIWRFNAVTTCDRCTKGQVETSSPSGVITLVDCRYCDGSGKKKVEPLMT